MILYYSLANFHIQIFAWKQIKSIFQKVNPLIKALKLVLKIKKLVKFLTQTTKEKKTSLELDTVKT